MMVDIGMVRHGRGVALQQSHRTSASRGGERCKLAEVRTAWDAQPDGAQGGDSFPGFLGISVPWGDWIGLSSF
jgi:hypothetical protein